MKVHPIIDGTLIAPCYIVIEQMFLDSILETHDQSPSRREPYIIVNMLISNNASYKIQVNLSFT